MDEYEILSLDYEIGIGLTLLFVWLFIKIKAIFVTYEKIERKSIKFGNSLTKVFMINKDINRINNVLFDLVNRDKEYVKLIEKKNHSKTFNIKNYISIILI